MSDAGTDWSELRDFRHLELPGSYVVGWTVKRGKLAVEVDFRLAPEHPLYEAPRPAEKACFRAGSIEFPDCTGVAAGDDPPGAPGDRAVALGVGAISGFRRIAEGEYRLSGEFGNVQIMAGRPVVRLAHRFFR